MKAEEIVFYVQKASAGDERAMRWLVESHKNLVFALARQEGGSQADHEDIAQETFLRAIRGISSLKDPARFTSWLCGIAINVCREHRRQRIRFLPWRHALERSVEPSQMEGMEEEMVRLLGSLPTKYRIPLSMRYASGASYAVISKVLRIPESTARSLVHRARARLIEMATKRGLLPR